MSRKIFNFPKLFSFYGEKRLHFPKRNGNINMKESEVIFMYTGRIETCSKRISKALAIRGMKQSELCRLAKIPKSSLSIYISGSYEPKQDRLYDMAKALDVDPVWLMGYDVPMEREKKTPDTIKLTEGEEMLLDLFRQVPVERQQMVLEMIKIALNTNQ